MVVDGRGRRSPGGRRHRGSHCPPRSHPSSRRRCCRPRAPSPPGAPRSRRRAPLIAARVTVAAWAVRSRELPSEARPLAATSPPRPDPPPRTPPGSGSTAGGPTVRPLADTDVVIVEAVRSPLGRRNGGLATVHPADLLGAVQRAAIERIGHRPRRRSARSSAAASPRSASRRSTSPAPPGSPPACRSTCAGTTVDAQCGSSQQATNLAAALVEAGVVDVALACGVESMSRIPLGVAVQQGPGRPLPKSYFERYEYATQFEAAERIADKWGITRDDCDRFGLESQERAAARVGRGSVRARGARRSTRPISTTTASRPARPTTSTRDEGLRETSLETLAGAQAGRARERRAHRRHVVADHRRRRRGAAHDRGPGEGARAARRGPASSTSASSASTRC